MNVYEELIIQLRGKEKSHTPGGYLLCGAAADAIETLLKELSESDILSKAETDIADLLWLNGNCEYCKFGQEEEYSGAKRWMCKLGGAADCRPQWRYAYERKSG